MNSKKALKHTTANTPCRSSECSDEDLPHVPPPLMWRIELRKKVKEYVCNYIKILAPVYICIYTQSPEARGEHSCIMSNWELQHQNLGTVNEVSCSSMTRSNDHHTLRPRVIKPSRFGDT
jgi:hypothetical protein